MTLTELFASGILPKSGVNFVIRKPMCGRYVSSYPYSWYEMETYLFKSDKFTRTFPWAKDKVFEVSPIMSGKLQIDLKGEIGVEGAAK